MKEMEEEIHFKGIPVNGGIAIGRSILLSEGDHASIPNFPITAGEVEAEIERYRRALSRSRKDLKKLQENLATEGSSDAVLILDAHIQMLDDPLMTTHMEEKIREMLKNTESVFHTVIKDYEARFAQMSDDFFQQKSSDVKGLTDRVLRHLCLLQKTELEEIPPNSIIFAKELIPSDAASVQASRVSAFVTQNGGTCHAALIARARGIPYVASIDVDKLQEAHGKCVIVDGLTGDIIVNPSSNTLEKYEDLRMRLTQQYQALEGQRELSSETQDGIQIALYANVNSLEDANELANSGCAGIGLFRSEFLFMNDHALFFDEYRQQLYYETLISKVSGAPCVIRFMDIGGDKYPELFQGNIQEANPALGCRGVRFLIQRPEIFQIQIRALLKAAVQGDVRLLIPFVSDIEEIWEVKRLIEYVKVELEAEGAIYKKQILIGCMMEIPSAVMVADHIGEEIDFFEIGTNDLNQHTLGIDRSHPTFGNVRFPLHPSLLKMIQVVVLSGQKCHKPVTICGEIASNPQFTELLLGLGIRAFSCAPRFLPALKQAIRRSNIEKSIQIANEALSMRTAAEIDSLLKS